MLSLRQNQSMNHLPYTSFWYMMFNLGPSKFIAILLLRIDKSFFFYNRTFCIVSATRFIKIQWNSILYNNNHLFILLQPLSADLLLFEYRVINFYMYSIHYFTIIYKNGGFSKGNIFDIEKQMLQMNWNFNLNCLCLLNSTVNTWTHFFP